MAKILRELDWFWYLPSEPPAASRERVRRHLYLCLADRSHSVYVAEDERGDVLGYAAVHWVPCLYLPGPEGYLSDLFVIESMREQGLGRRLLEVVEREAAERGCFRLSVLIRRQRESYRRLFFEKNGWEEQNGMANFVLMI